MKKHYLAAALLALALGLTACSSEPKETTTAATEAQAEAETTEASEDSEDEEAAEVEYFYGLVEEAADKTITVKNDEEVTAKFDVSEAKLSGAEEIGQGDEVEVAYAGELSSDVTKAESVDIVTSAAAEAEEEAEAEEDPIISGTIEEAGEDTLTLKAEEGTYTFNTKIAQKVTKDGMKAGVQADVTYYGDLEDDSDQPVATKIVTEDAADTEDAKINTLTGKAAEAGTDYVVLATADPANTLFTFLGTAGMFDGVKAGDEVTVIYTGTLTNKTITAVGVK